MSENNAKKVKITADSTCDLPQEIIDKYDIEILPLYVILGDDNFKDRQDIEPQKIYDYVEENRVLPKTSAATVNDYLDIFKKYEDRGVVHLNISSHFSSSHQNAVIASKECSNVAVIDSLNLSTGSGHLVVLAAELANEGKSPEEIKEAVDKIAPFVRASFIVDTLEYLKMGGRCSSVAAFGANLLKLHPCIEVIDGSMIAGKKYRGKMAGILKEYVDVKLADLNKIDSKRVFITYSLGTDPEVVDTLVQHIKDLNYFEEIISCVAGCVITSHCGPGTLGVLFIEKPE